MIFFPTLLNKASAAACARFETFSSFGTKRSPDLLLIMASASSRLGEIKSNISVFRDLKAAGDVSTRSLPPAASIVLAKRSIALSGWLLGRLPIIKTISPFCVFFAAARQYSSQFFSVISGPSPLNTVIAEDASSFIMIAFLTSPATSKYSTSCLSESKRSL